MNGPVFLGGKRLKGWAAKLMPTEVAGFRLTPKLGAALGCGTI